MAKDIKFNVRLTIDGKEQIISATTNAKQFQKGLDKAKSSADQLRDRLITFNQASESFKGVRDSLKELTEAMGGLAAGAQKAQVVSKKLEEVMRQRMGATKEDVASINEVITAQKELGVIGGTVQKNGAQQVATFLTQASSIRVLLPAMNDLLAQQKGVNATQEDAYGIANLMGKAMQGQTSALRRVGITFSEAEAKVLKYGNESERAAMLAQVITNNVGHMNAELAKTSAGKLKQMENSLAGIKSKLGGVIQNWLPFVSIASQTATLATSLLSLAASARAAGASLLAVVTSSRAYAAATVLSRMATARIITALRTYTSVSYVSAAATRLLSGAIRGLMVATGVGIAIAGVTMLIEALMSKSEKTKDTLVNLRDVQEQERATLQDTRAALELNIAKLHDFNGTKQQENKVVQEMNQTYGSTMGYFSSVSDWYKALTANSKAYCDQMVNETRLRSLANKAAELEQNIHDIRYDENGKARKYSTKRQKQVDTSKPSHYVDAGDGVMVPVYDNIKELPSDLDKANTKIRQMQSVVSDIKKQMQDTARAAATITMPVAGAKQAPDLTTTTTAPKTPKEKVEKALQALDLQEAQSQVAVSKPGALQDIGGFDDIAQLRINKVEALKAQAERMRELFEAGVIPATAAQQAIDGINKELDTLGARKVTIDVDAAKLEETRTKTKDAASAIAKMGSSLAGLGDAVGLPALNIVGTMAQAVANMVLSYSQALTQSAAFGPWGWLAFGATGLVQLVSMISTVKNVGKFAAGGIAYGPTLGLFGEYAGASSNPEVVAPLDRLRSMLQPQSINPANFTFEVKGDRLVAVLANTTRTSRRATNIRLN